MPALADPGPIAALPWPLWGWLGLLGAVLVLDDTAWVQSWLSRPLPAASLAGLAAGDPATGVVLGLVLELVCLGSMPVGRTLVGEPSSAAVAGTGAIAATGWHLDTAALVGGAGAPLLGWMLLGASLWALLAGLSVRWERRGNQRWMLAGNRHLRRGALGGFERLHGLCLALTAARGLVLTLAGLLVLRGLWLPLLAELPPRLREGIALWPLLAAPLAVGNLIDHFGWRAGWRWLIGGAVLGFAGARWLI